MTNTIAPISLNDSNIGDAVVVVLNDGSQQSAILHSFDGNRAFFAWRFNRNVRAFNCCSIPVKDIATRVLAIFPRGCNFLAV